MLRLALDRLASEVAQHEYALRPARRRLRLRRLVRRGAAYGLGAGMLLPEAIELAARCGAAVLCGRGPYGAMLDPVG